MAEAAQAPIVIRRQHLLFVEGKQDAVVFGAALQVIARANDIQIVDCGGKNRMREVYTTFTLQGEFRSVLSYGVVRDADTNANGAFQSVCAMLQGAGEPRPAQSGAFVVDPKRRVGVYVLPDNNLPGCLETLFIATIGNASFVQRVNQYVGTLAQVLPQLAQGQQKVAGSFYVPSHTDKARALAALAGTHEPALEVGRAAEHGYWDWNNQAIVPLMNFLRAI